jgi:uncharacterized protein with NRDE domain
VCLIALAIQPPGPWLLVVAANRDEFHDRHAAPASWWRDRDATGQDRHPPILAGRDLQGGGTWLGMRRGAQPRSLRIAALTNLRPGLMPPRGLPPEPDSLPTATPAVPPSRGRLVADFLAGDQPPADFLRTLSPAPAAYAGFNLLAIETSCHDGVADAWYVNNLPGSMPRSLTTGLHVLSNATLGVPWPKTRLLGNALQAALANEAAPTGGTPAAGADDAACLVETLMAALGDRTPADVAALPATGLDPTRERLLSAPFIADDHYGTRCSTVLLVGRDGKVLFTERSFGPGGAVRATVTERLALE